jgi:hypothetical protein
MPIFYYQIKGKNSNADWSWPPLYSDKIEAEDSQEARKALEEMYGMKLPGRELKNQETPLLLTIIDATNKAYILARFDDKSCQQCGITFTLHQKYMMQLGGPQDFCSEDCSKKFKEIIGVQWDVNYDFNGIHEPVIYKITCIANGKCYIGKTTQAFTLRWYQHFFQPGSTSFHLAIKQHGLSGWTFEVVEIIKYPEEVKQLAEKRKYIFEREMHYINLYDSIKNGYNSVPSLKAETERIDMPELF